MLSQIPGRKWCYQLHDANKAINLKYRARPHSPFLYLYHVARCNTVHATMFAYISIFPQVCMYIGIYICMYVAIHT